MYNERMGPGVYIETSVVSYFTARPSRDLVAAGHQQTTQEWWHQVLPHLTPYICPAVLLEISQGDPELAARRHDVSTGNHLGDRGLG